MLMWSFLLQLFWLSGLTEHFPSPQGGECILHLVKSLQVHETQMLRAVLAVGKGMVACLEGSS